MKNLPTTPSVNPPETNKEMNQYKIWVVTVIIGMADIVFLLWRFWGHGSANQVVIGSLALIFVLAILSDFYFTRWMVVSRIMYILGSIASIVVLMIFGYALIVSPVVPSLPASGGWGLPENFGLGIYLSIIPLITGLFAFLWGPKKYATLRLSIFVATICMLSLFVGLIK